MADHNQDLELRILSYVGKAGYQPVKPRVIAKRLGISRDDVGEVKQAVKRLVRRGQLAYGPSHAVRPPEPSRPSSPRVVGVFQRTQKGFGFVRPKSLTSKRKVDPSDRPPDIYIPAKKARDAATGDVVVVQLMRHRRGETRLEGEIIEILERENNQFVGTYFEHAGSGFVQADGTMFAEPIRVGDPGAKGARPEDKVVFEMLRFPSHLHRGEGVISEVLGPRGEPGVDTLSVIREYNLPERFPAEVLSEAREEARRFDDSDLQGRLDLTDETIITIDPVDARDFDDAISLQRLENGHWRLGVHIADVAHFVRPGTALDHEAYRRATSVYLPDRVLPMLPEVISNGLASLQPGKVRYARTVFMQFTPEGLRTDAEFHASAISSTKRLTYEEVDEFLADPKAGERKLGKPVSELLARMHELAMVLRRRRFEHGALEMSLTEVKVDLDDSGHVTGAHAVEETVSHQIIEEFMLAANEAVAQTLEDKDLIFMRRVHPSPDERKLQSLGQFVKELGFHVESLQSRFELQRLLKLAAERPQRHAVNFAVLRSLQRAVYSPEEEGHYALASSCYCHFTSPIRRYPDVTVHRLLGQVLANRRPRQDFDELALAAEHCSNREQRAEQAERDVTKLKLLGYLSTRIGEEMDALVTGVESFGLFLQGVDLPAEGLIHADSLADDFYDFDRTTHSLTGRRTGRTYRLGDLLRVAVARVDLERRELDFRLVQRKRESPAHAAIAAQSRGRRRAKPSQSPNSDSDHRRGKRKASFGRKRKAGH